MTQHLEERMNTESLTGPSGGEHRVVAVDADKLRDLADIYTLYEQALIEPGDPVRVLTLTGDVLAAGRPVVSGPGNGRGVRR